MGINHGVSGCEGLNLGNGVKAIPKVNHDHYYKICPYDKIDVYRVIDLFGITDPCLQHMVKKCLVAGGRGHKDIGKDIQDIIDTAERWKQMRKEDQENG